MRQTPERNRQTKSTQILWENQKGRFRLPLQLQLEIPRFYCLYMGTQNRFDFDEQRNGDCPYFWRSFRIFQPQIRANLQSLFEKYINHFSGPCRRVTGCTLVHSHSGVFTVVGNGSSKGILKVDIRAISQAHKSVHGFHQLKDNFHGGIRHGEKV